MKSKAANDWEEFGQLWNPVIAVIRKENNNYFSNGLLKLNGDNCSMWKLSNYFTDKANISYQVLSISRLEAPQTSDPLEVAEEYNTYFATYASKLSDETQAPNEDQFYNVPALDHDFSFELLDVATVLNKLLKLNQRKATGPDNIPPRLLNVSASGALGSTYCISCIWSHSERVETIQVRGQIKCCQLLRISNLCVISKVMDRLIQLFLSYNPIKVA